MDKSADAFRTISEVAEHLDTPAHVLRFWESRFPQIRPVKRAGGRRYYRPSDVALLTGIKRLLHDEGMTIRGVQKILREQGVRHVSGMASDLAEDVEDGDRVDGDDYDAPFGNQIDDVVDTTGVVPAAMSAEPVAFRPAPGLAAAMAKAVDHGQTALRPVGPSTVLPIVAASAVEPAQGTLLLTPSRVEAADAAPGDVIAGKVDDAVLRPAVSDFELTSSSPSLTPVDVGKAANAAIETEAMLPEVTYEASDFDSDDDFDDLPAVVLAARIRALPAGASAAKVGSELLGVVARLHALRDAMADAGRTGAA